uniref:Uncharacterized protein n=1 Tax=Arcella intermedia TaxID=1963864 RepID=A0A6B2LJD9_9EUKA|eukprot:TRINITY_DN791_c0_g1_i1.p1 TRINITY_DN791_c0_g1~~TRINITY_DN791_c0_g1_i1.p1  ORF type:complete len:216 (+),score=35.21 TRINITY_DN791_c0_g1_i1:47-649(+)
MAAENVKLVTVGDGACGKTSLLLSYVNNQFPTEYVPTIFDNYVAYAHFGGRVVSVSLWDTAGQEDYDRLRPLSYPGTDVFLVCFSLVNRTSFQNVKTRWVPEIEHYCPAQTILVGTKADMREDPEKLAMLREGGLEPITREEGREFAGGLNLASYVECSALLGKGVKDVFETAVRLVFDKKEEKAALKKKKINKKQCTLL